MHTHSAKEFHEVVFNPDNQIVFCEHVNENVDRIQLRERDPDPPLTNNVCLAALITSYGRCKLYKYMDMVPANDLLYTDTDSVFFISRAGKLAFPFGSMLGEMTREEADKRIVSWR